MPLSAILPYIPAAIGGLQALFERPYDPMKEQRKQIKGLIRELESRPERQRARLAAEFAPVQAAATKRISDRAAASGLPRNVQLQMIGEAQQDQMNTLLNEMARLGADDMQTYSLMARMVGMTPPEPNRNWGGDLLSLGLNLATLPMGSAQRQGQSAPQAPVLNEVNPPSLAPEAMVPQQTPVLNEVNLLESLPPEAMVPQSESVPMNVNNKRKFAPSQNNPAPVNEFGITGSADSYSLGAAGVGEVLALPIRYQKGFQTPRVSGLAQKQKNKAGFNLTPLARVGR